MRILAVVLTWVILASPGLAQSRAPTDGAVTRSLGQPERWKWSIGAGTGWPIHNNADARVAVFRDLVNPVTSIGGVHLEGYLGTRAGEFEPGLRLRLLSPFARFGIGADWSNLDGTDFLVSFQHPLRRGGVFHDGSSVRVDYVPSRDHQLSLGIEKPILRRGALGRTRPYADAVNPATSRVAGLPVSVPTPAIDSELANLRDAGDWIRRLTSVFLDHDAPNRPEGEAAVTRALQQLQQSMNTSDGRRRSAAVEVERYHASLERAFTIAVAGQSDLIGREVADRARSILLDEVLLPYNRLLGQRKRTDSLHDLNRRAQRVFADWLGTRASVQSANAAQSAFAALLDAMEHSRRALRDEWGDSRFVWLPLQYALRPEDHDTQPEIDALIERAVGASFTEGNFVSYAINEQYQYQLSRTIRQAEDYHVLWTHDVRGFDDHGQPDEMAYRQILRSYLAALIERVKDYDRSGKFPVYIILLDQWFYEVNRGRLWLSLLEDPTRHRLQLPAGNIAWQDSIAAAQTELRTAIASSTRLQEQRRRFGEAWLRSLIKVHVNITNPADATFWSWHVVPFLPMPDNMMRDHRKLAFYDITEADPYKGEALFTGAGVAEHYASLSWEERTLVVRGPALLGLKREARELLLQQGMKADEIPFGLQLRDKPADYEARILRAAQRDQTPVRALGIHNGTGFNPKPVNVAKAVLYTLMPAGSVIKIPDSLWNSGFWASALCGAALRGVRVLIIAPSEANHPVPKFAAFSRGQELLWRLLTARTILDADITAAHGLLRIGVYSPDFEVTNIPAKVRSVQTTFSQHEWLRDLFGFPPTVYEGLLELSNQLSGLAMAPEPVPEFEYDPKPKLHLKANFFASREGWQLMARPEWGAMTWSYVMARIAQVQDRSIAVRSFAEHPEPWIDVGGPEVQSWYVSLSRETRERVVFYTMMGSHNQNLRSMAIDGEVGFLVAGWPSIIPYLDFISLIGQSRWLNDASELEVLLPPQPGWRWRFARWVKLVT